MTRYMQKINLLILPTLLLTASLLFVGASSSVHAASASGFVAGRIIDDDVFTAYNALNQSQIQSFLNSKVPSCDTNGTLPASEYGRSDLTHAQYAASRGWGSPPFTCLRNYTEGGKSAAQIIYEVSQQFRINPDVLIVLLQKEQGLITDTWPLSSQYRSATGYGCPDTAACDSQYYGFTNQVTWAAKMFRAIMDESPTWYTPYVMGNNYIRYSPDVSCGGSTVNIQTRATQALYNYTPYQPTAASLNAGYGDAPGSCDSHGNRNFFYYFTDWFGSTFGNSFYSCHYASNLSGTPTGLKVIPNQFYPSGNTTFSMVLLNNTGSQCVEIHTWENSRQAWATNVATNIPAIDPSRAEVIDANIYGDGKDELVFVLYNQTGSGQIEIHTWDPTYQRWVSNVATNHPAVSMSDARVIAADTDGNGQDELVLVRYQNSGSGKIEVHTWAPGQQRWISNVATNLPATDPSQGRVIAADTNGDGKDELIYVKYQNTSSGKIEVHTWAPGQQRWISNVATNHSTLPVNEFDVIAGNVYGGRPDELVLVKYRNTGSGNIELHTWAPGQQSWISNIATNVPVTP